MALARQTWDHTVLVTVATGLGGIPQTLSFDRSDLVDFAFFRNLPLPDDEDFVRVDLVEGKLSPWPVDGDALATLLHICSPLAMFGPEPACAPTLHSVMMDHDTCLMRLLDTAEALVLDFRGKEALAQRFDDVVTEFVGDRDLFFIKVHDAEGRPAYADANVAQPWMQAEDGHWLLGAALHTESDGPDVTQCIAQLTPGVVLPVARWAAGQLYMMLDRLSLRQAQAALARDMVNPGNMLLHGDKGWRQQLKQWAVEPQLSPAGRSILFDVALSTTPYDCACSCSFEELLAIDCTRSELFHKREVHLAPGVKLGMACWTANSLDVGLDIYPSERDADMSV